MMTVSKTLAIEGRDLNKSHYTYGKPIVGIIRNGRKLKDYVVKLVLRHGNPLFLFSVIMGTYSFNHSNKVQGMKLWNMCGI